MSLFNTPSSLTEADKVQLKLRFNTLIKSRFGQKCHVNVTDEDEVQLKLMD